MQPPKDEQGLALCRAIERARKGLDVAYPVKTQAEAEAARNRLQSLLQKARLTYGMRQKGACFEIIGLGKIRLEVTP